MKCSLPSLALVVLIHGPGDAAAQSAFDLLAWLEGDWVRKTKHGEATESWIRVSDHTMEGVAFVASGDSVRISEYLRIEQFGDEVFYTAKPSQNPFPTSFRMTEHGRERFVFENPDHDFPQRIIYTWDGDDALMARIEGLLDGEVQRMDFSFERKR